MAWLQLERARLRYEAEVDDTGGDDDDDSDDEADDAGGECKEDDDRSPYEASD